jgi:hypothetical protein
MAIYRSKKMSEGGATKPSHNVVSTHIGQMAGCAFERTEGFSEGRVDYGKIRKLKNLRRETLEYSKVLASSGETGRRWRALNRVHNNGAVITELNEKTLHKHVKDLREFVLSLVREGLKTEYIRMGGNLTGGDILDALEAEHERILYTAAISGMVYDGKQAYNELLTFFRNNRHLPAKKLLEKLAEEVRKRGGFVDKFKSDEHYMSFLKFSLVKAIGFELGEEG